MMVGVGVSKKIKKKRKIQRGGLIQFLPFLNLLKGGGEIKRRKKKKSCKKKKKSVWRVSCLFCSNA